VKKSLFVFFLFLFCIPIFASAEDLELNPGMSQSDFKSMAKELGVAISFNPMSPAEPLGILGFDISTEVVVTDINSKKQKWKLAFEDQDTLPVLTMTRVHVQKGLPFNIDVGAMYAGAPSTNIRVWGLELKYAILKGGVVAPAISVRTTFSKMENVSDLDAYTYSGELLISKGFLFLTPYAGFTALRVNADEDSKNVDLDDVHETIYRGVLGLQATPFPLVKINLETSFGVVNQYGVSVGIRF